MENSPFAPRGDGREHHSSHSNEYYCLQGRMVTAVHNVTHVCTHDMYHIIN